MDKLVDFEAINADLKSNKRPTISQIGREVVGDIVYLSTSSERLKGSVSIRLDDEEYAQFRHICKQDDRSITNGIYYLINVCYQEVASVVMEEENDFLYARMSERVEPPVFQRPNEAKQRTVWLKQPGYDRMKFLSWYIGYQSDAEFVEGLVRGVLGKYNEQ